MDRGKSGQPFKHLICVEHSRKPGSAEAPRGDAFLRRAAVLPIPPEGFIQQLSQKYNGFRLVFEAGRRIFSSFFVNYHQIEQKNRAGGSERGKKVSPHPGCGRHRQRIKSNHTGGVARHSLCGRGTLSCNHTYTTLGGKNNGMFLGYRR